METLHASMMSVENLSLEELEEKIEVLNMQISRLQEENSKILEGFVTRQCHTEAKLRHITKALPTLKILHSDALKVAEIVIHTSALAEDISAKVRQMDSKRTRVSECQQRVNDLQDLKLCRKGVSAAMETGDYEKAAGHVHRFLAMDQMALRRTAAHVSQGSSVDDCFKQLEAAATELKKVVAENFDQAARCDNVAEIERFFKIFPLLGASAEGLGRFSAYLASRLGATAQQNLRTVLETASTDKRAPVLYADAITLLFEGVARVVETHQPLVETYYGPGHLIDVMDRLQSECDKESRRILAEMAQRRCLENIVRQVDEVLRGGASLSTHASSASLVSLASSSNGSTSQSHHRSGSTGSVGSLDHGSPDPRELDPLLGELAICHSRAELYMRFVRRRITADLDVGCEDGKNEALTRLDNLLGKSELCRAMQELLGHFLLLERYYMRESVRKAMTLDALDEAGHTSSVLDDVFFILRKCIRRASSTGSLDGACAVINDACTLLEMDFGSFLQRQLRQGYSSGYLDLTAQAYSMWQSSLQQGRIGQSGTDADKPRAIFLAHLNNADTSTEYINTLRRGLEEDIVASLGRNLPSQESAKLVSCLAGLGSAAAALKHVAEYGLQQLRASAVKPRTGPWVDAFLQANHQLSEEEFAGYEADEPFVQNLIQNLEGLLSSFKPKLTPSNYDALVSLVTSEVTVQMEKVIMKSSFNRLGGLALDKEVRALAGYLTSATTFSVRDKLARLTQIATVLNLERPGEMADYWGPAAGQLAWRLSASEVRQIMALRVDFKAEEIKKLKL